MTTGFDLDRSSRCAGRLQAKSRLAAGGMVCLLLFLCGAAVGCALASWQRGCSSEQQQLLRVRDLIRTLREVQAARSDAAAAAIERALPDLVAVLGSADATPAVCGTLEELRRYYGSRTEPQPAALGPAVESCPSVGAGLSLRPSHRFR